VYVFVSREEYRVKYIVQTEISAKVGAEVEANPAMIQEVVGAWQALKPIGHVLQLDPTLCYGHRGRP
jgi:hypothetical protein